MKFLYFFVFVLCQASRNVAMRQSATSSKVLQFFSSKLGKQINVAVSQNTVLKKIMIKDRNIYFTHSVYDIKVSRRQVVRILSIFRKYVTVPEGLEALTLRFLRHFRTLTAKNTTKLGN